MIINITYHKHSENVIEIMFHSINNDWFVSLFPKSDVDFVAIFLLHITVGCMRRFAQLNFQFTTELNSKLSYTPCYMNVKLNNMKTKLVKTKYADETFYVQLNEKLDIWERIDNGKYYHTDDLIFIRDV